MKRPTFSFGQTVVKFFEPLRAHPIQMIIASVIIGIALYVGIDIGLAEVVRQNSYDIHMLSTEMLIELGPDYASESERYAEIIKRYTKHLEQRRLATVLRLLYPEYSPKKRLESVLLALEKVAYDEEEARRAIWKAGLASNQLYVHSKRFPQSPFKWFESEDLPVPLLYELDNAFDTFHMQVDKLKNAQTIEDAVDGCRVTCSSSRRVILLLFLARLSYDNEEKIERFLTDLKESRDSALFFAEKYKSEEKIFYDRARIKDCKVKILEAMLANDMDKVQDILDAIEIASEKEKPP